MSKFEFFAIFIPAALAIGKLLIGILQKTDPPFTAANLFVGLKKIELDSVVTTVMLAIVMGAALKIIATGLPKLDTLAERTEAFAQQSTDMLRQGLPRLDALGGRTEALAQQSTDMLRRDVEPLLQDLQKGLSAFITIANADSAVDEMPKSIELAFNAVRAIPDDAIKALFADYYKTTARNFMRELVSIKENKLNIRKEDVLAFAQRVTRGAEKTIDASSFVDPKVWWEGPDAKYYLKVNKAAVDRGVRVRRIFGWKTVEERAELERTIAAEQYSAGIEVYLVPLDETPTWLQNDLIIVDGKLAGLLSISQVRDFESVLVTTRVEETQRNFDLLIKDRKPFCPLNDRCPKSKAATLEHPDNFR